MDFSVTPSGEGSGPISSPADSEPHRHCACIGPLLGVTESLLRRVGELEEAAKRHIETHRRDALRERLGPDERVVIDADKYGEIYDRKAD